MKRVRADGWVYWTLAAFCAAALLPQSVDAADLVRRDLASGAYASLLSGRDDGGARFGLEVVIPEGRSAQRFLQRYLAIESEWIAYRGTARAFIPSDRLKPEVRRQALLALFPTDRVDDRGWRHTVTYAGETLFSLTEWIAGNGHRYGEVLGDDGKPLASTSLSRGQRLLFPAAILPPVMRQFTPASAPREPAPQPQVAPAPNAVAEANPAPAISANAFVEAAEVETPVALDGLLEFATDRNGEHALYRLKKGEALFTSVVVRFTDIREHADVLEACTIIARRSGVRDVTDIAAGTEIRIPVDMLSDRYKPHDTPERKAYVAAVRESERLRKAPVQSRDLSDVVVILDPGHGGTDHGAYHTAMGLYEDELNYDIVCRIKKLLERDTGAKVYVTLADKSQGYEPTDTERFTHDRDEHLLTNPRYNLTDTDVGVNLRYMLVNSIYDQERKRGVDSRKIVFASIHTDSLYNQNLRGTMVYVPGAKWRRESESRSGPIYARYEEGRDYNRFTSTSAERLRDEAMSRSFALTLLDELGKKRIKRHDKSDPIRSQIVSGRGQKPWVPGVLRNSDVPTKVLIETANLMNPTDRDRLADPWWRQQFAHAYVDALKRHFAADGADSEPEAMEAD